MENGVARQEQMAVTGCLDNLFQNGDLDFDGTDYQAVWPDGSNKHPTPWQYAGPFGPDGKLYPQIQFETNAPASESLCNTTTGTNCVVKPLGSNFYPFWTMNNKQSLSPALRGLRVELRQRPAGNHEGVRQDRRVRHPDLARFGGDADQPGPGQPGAGKGLPQHPPLTGRTAFKAPLRITAVAMLAPVSAAPAAGRGQPLPEVSG
jgi:hypothetical protein